MFVQLLVSICLSALARGNHSFEDVPASESRGSVPELEALNAALNPESSNLTYDQRWTGGGSLYGAHIERVNLRKCPKWSAYLPHFYEGLVVNSRAWKTKNNERFTSVALTDGGVTISSSAGAIPPRKDYIFSTWEMLDMNKVSQDIRVKAPTTVHFRTWNAMQQIYIPLYLANEDYGIAYMLHIYPEPDFLLNPPADTTFVDGLWWAKGDKNRLYSLEIDVAGMIRNLEDFAVPWFKNYITVRGVTAVDERKLQSQVAYSDHRQVSLQSSTLSSATEYICRDVVRPIDLTWTEMKAILQQQFLWL